VNERMSDCQNLVYTTIHYSTDNSTVYQGWATAHFENVQSLFLKCEKSAIKKFALFSHIFAHSLFSKVGLYDLLHF